MKEFDEEEAAAAMVAAIKPAVCSVDDAIEVLDMVYDYLEHNNFLDLSLDDDREPDVDKIVEYVSAQIRKHPLSVPLTNDQIRLMLEAEDNYEAAIAEAEDDI